MQTLRKDMKKKTMAVKPKYLLYSIILSESQFTLKNSLLNENENLSPLNNEINSNNDYYKNKKENNFKKAKSNTSNIINKNSKVEEKKEIDKNKENKEIY